MNDFEDPSEESSIIKRKANDDHELIQKPIFPRVRQNARKTTGGIVQRHVLALKKSQVLEGRSSMGGERANFINLTRVNDDYSRVKKKPCKVSSVFERKANELKKEEESALQKEARYSVYGHNTNGFGFENESEEDPEEDMEANSDGNCNSHQMNPGDSDYVESE